MNTIEVDLSSTGANFKLKLVSNDILPLSKYNLISLIDYQHLPPYLISKDNFKLNINNELSDQKEINNILEFIEILFKSSISTNKIISLLLNTENPNVFGIIFPDIITNDKYSIKLGYIDLNDNFISKFLINYNNNNNNNLSVNKDNLNNESQSTLAKSLNAHIIRRKFKTTNNSSSSPTSSVTSTTTTINNNNNLTIEPSIIFTSDNFITSMERLIKGEFRMRRFNSKFDNITLRKFEKLLIRSVIFKFRDRSGMQFIKENNKTDQSHNNNGNVDKTVIKISVSEIQDTLESLIPVLL